MNLLIVQRPQISEEEISDVRSKFTIEPLEPGFRLHARQLAASHSALIDPGRCYHPDQDRRGVA